MARSLSNLIFKGIASYPSARSSRIVRILIDALAHLGLGFSFSFLGKCMKCYREDLVHLMKEIVVVC